MAGNLIVLVVIYIQRVQVRLVTLKTPEGYKDMPSPRMKINRVKLV